MAMRNPVTFLRYAFPRLVARVRSSLRWTRREPSVGLEAARTASPKELAALAARYRRSPGIQILWLAHCLETGDHAAARR